MTFVEWNVGGEITWDWAVLGGRSRVDLKKMKVSVNHQCFFSEGWMRTDLHGGRSKLERKRGVRQWWMYRVCMCPGGKHVGIPDGFMQTIAHSGNPTNGVPFCSTCPLNMFECVDRLLPSDDHRLYPRWLPGCSRFHFTDNVGTKRLTVVANQWLKAQGACPDNAPYSSNMGRKAHAYWCDATNTPYEESFEIHGDLPCTWNKYYQPSCKIDKSFRRRTQSTDPEVCLKGLRRFAMFCGRGPSDHVPEDMSRLEKLLALNSRNMGAQREVAQILLQG